MSGIPIFDGEIKANTGMPIFDPGIFDTQRRTNQVSTEFGAGSYVGSSEFNLSDYPPKEFNLDYRRNRPA